MVIYGIKGNIPENGLFFWRPETRSNPWDLTQFPWKKNDQRNANISLVSHLGS